MPEEEIQDQTAVRIIDAALACFEDLGIRRTSMDDIARTAGVGRTTVFRRFEGKEHLAQIVVHRILTEMTDKVRAAYNVECDLETGLTAALSVSVRELHSQPLFVKVLRVEPDAFLRMITSDGDSVIAVVRRSVVDWLSEGGGGPLTDDDAEMVAEGIVRLGMSLILAPEGSIPVHDDERLRAYIARYLVPGIVWLAAQSQP